MGLSGVAGECRVQSGFLVGSKVQGVRVQVFPSWDRALTYLTNPYIQAGELEEILKLDESCISNPKSEISNWTVTNPEARAVQSEISDFGFEMQDSSNFKISFRVPA